MVPRIVFVGRCILGYLCDYLLNCLCTVWPSGAVAFCHCVPLVFDPLVLWPSSAVTSGAVAFGYCDPPVLWHSGYFGFPVAWGLLLRPVMLVRWLESHSQFNLTGNLAQFYCWEMAFLWEQMYLQCLQPWKHW